MVSVLVSSSESSSEGRGTNGTVRGSSMGKGVLEKDNLGMSELSMMNERVI